MGVLETISAFFGAEKATAEAVTARTKPVENQVEQFNEQKALRVQDFGQEMINDDFRYLKNRTEIDGDALATYFKTSHPDFTDDKLIKYETLVMSRVVQYRYDNRHNFFLPKVVKWAKENLKK